MIDRKLIITYLLYLYMGDEYCEARIPFSIG